MAITIKSGVLTINATNTNTITTLDDQGASGTYSILSSGIALGYTLKKLMPGTNVAITNASAVLTINAPAPTEANSGAQSLLHDNGAPNYALKKLTPGTNVAINDGLGTNHQYHRHQNRRHADRSS